MTQHSLPSLLSLSFHLCPALCPPPTPWPVSMSTSWATLTSADNLCYLVRVCSGQCRHSKPKIDSSAQNNNCFVYVWLSSLTTFTISHLLDPQDYLMYREDRCRKSKGAAPLCLWLGAVTGAAAGYAAAAAAEAAGRLQSRGCKPSLSAAAIHV